MTAPTIEEVLFWVMHAEAIDHLTTCPRNDGPNGLCCDAGALLDEAADEAGLRMTTVSGGWES